MKIIYFILFIFILLKTSHGMSLRNGIKLASVFKNFVSGENRAGFFINYEGENRSGTVNSDETDGLKNGSKIHARILEKLNETKNMNKKLQEFSPALLIQLSDICHNFSAIKTLKKLNSTITRENYIENMLEDSNGTFAVYSDHKNAVLKLADELIFLEKSCSKLLNVSTTVSRRQQRKMQRIKTNMKNSIKNQREQMQKNYFPSKIEKQVSAAIKKTSLAQFDKNQRQEQRQAYQQVANAIRDQLNDFFQDFNIFAVLVTNQDNPFQGKMPKNQVIRFQIEKDDFEMEILVIRSPPKSTFIQINPDLNQIFDKNHVKDLSSFESTWNDQCSNLDVCVFTTFGGAKVALTNFNGFFGTKICCGDDHFFDVHIFKSLKPDKKMGYFSSPKWFRNSKFNISSNVFIKNQKKFNWNLPRFCQNDFKSKNV